MRKAYILVLAAVLTVSCQESLEKRAAREARLYTQKNCPSELSETVVMDSLTFDEASRTLHYWYTFRGAADSVGSINAEEARATLLKEVNNTTSLADFKEAGFSFCYTYHSQKEPQRVLYEARFEEKDYNAEGQANF